jgi:exodeoxyribonuclease-3
MITRNIKTIIGCGINMKIICWNVNGIRAINKKGFKEFVLNNNFDVICIQEAKAHSEDLINEHVIDGFDCVWHQGVKKGYSGVAIWVKKDFKYKSRVGLGIEKFDNEGRTAIVEFEKFILYNGYFPNGQEDHARVNFKLEYSNSVLDWAKKQSKPVIICGDLNTAHKEMDLSNPMQNRNTTGFLPQERKFLDNLEKNNFVDIIRQFNPHGDYYTWWSYRTAARSRNIGWRIDYFWVDKRLENKVSTAYHLTNVLGSDHCPIVLEINHE